MTATEGDVPEAWDQIREPTPELEMEAVDVEPAPTTQRPSRLSLMGAAWGDLVTILCVCTGTFAALELLGYGAAWRAVPWALALGVAWWTTATVVLLVVRQGTPGMLLSGVVFEDSIPRDRVAWVVLTALVLCVTLGLPALLGSHAWPLRLAAGVEVAAAAGYDDAFA